MSDSTNTFRKKISTYGKQINVLIEFNEIKLDKKRIVSVKRHVLGEFLSSVMRLVNIEIDKGLDIAEKELLLVKDVQEMTIEQLGETRVKYLSGISAENQKICEAKEMNIKIGVKLENDNEYEYTDWGEFVIYECIDSVDTNSYKLTLYDHLIDTHIKYDDEPLNLDFSSGKITVGILFQAICDKFGFINKTPIFTNSDKLVQEDKFLGLGVYYRDILDEIACVAGGFIKIFNKDIYVANPIETDEIIDENTLKSLDVGERIGPFNTLVLSRSPQEDNIYYPTNISEDERIALRIENNQIMDKNREDFIVDLYNKINGLEYYSFEYESFGAGYHEFGDIITLKDLNGKKYKTIIMNVIDDINSGITEEVYSEKTNFAETKYEYATSIEKRIRNTEIICDKQNNKIQLLVAENSILYQSISEIQLDIDGITETIIQLASNLDDVKNDAIKEAVEQADKNLGMALENYPTNVEVATQIEEKAGEITTQLTATIDIKLDNYTNSDELAAMFSKYSTTIEMQNYVYETVSSFERTITEEITTQINNITISTENLIYNSVGMLGIDSWGVSEAGALSTNYDASRYSISKRAIILTTKSQNSIFAYTPRFEIIAEETYSISGWVLCSGESKGLAIHIFSSKSKTAEEPYQYIDHVHDYQEQLEIHADFTVKAVNEMNTSLLNSSSVNSFFGELGEWHYFEKTFTVKNDVKSAFIRIENKGTIISDTNSIVYVSDLMVNYGNKPVHWNVSSKDAQSQIETNSTSILQNAEAIKLKLDSSKFTSEAVIGLINNRDGTSTAKIKATNIELTAENILSIISGNEINLTSRNITFNSTNFKVDKNGKVTCVDGEFSGKVTATSGKIGAFDIDAGFSLITDDNAKFIIDKGGIQFLSAPVIGSMRKVILEIKVDDPTQIFTTSITNSQIISQQFKRNGYGYVVTGADTNHTYYQNWTGSYLQEYVDGNYVGIVGIINNGYAPYTGEIPIVQTITARSDGGINWTYSKLHVYNGLIYGIWN